MTGTTFTQGWVNGWIIIITLINLLGCLWLLWWTRKRPEDKIPQGEPLDHAFDGIQELNNPLPHWWLNLFYITIVFALVYLTLYPGWGDAKGVLGWTSHGQWELEVEKANNRYDRVFAEFASVSVEELSNDPQAIKIGQRLFGNNCALCHGSDARGNKGYPNLTDNDWLYGGTPDQIVATITNGRNAMMPPGGGLPMSEQDVKDMAAYVLTLSGRKGSGNADAAKPKFAVCSACHGPDAAGNHMMGGPNLADNIWLYGGSEKDIIETLTSGRYGKMPAFKDTLSAEKIHVLSAYVYSLSK